MNVKGLLLNFILLTIAMVIFIMFMVMMSITAFAQTTMTNDQYKEYTYLDSDEMLGESMTVENTQEIKPDIGYSDEEMDILAHIINAEAKGESFEGKVAVGNIILNRVKSSEFPDTIRDVVYQPRQFQPVYNGAINEEPSEEAIKAAYACLNTNVVGDALYFYNPNTATDSWIRTRSVVKTIGSHRFSL